jgi:hypothetical protein
VNQRKSISKVLDPIVRSLIAVALPSGVVIRVAAFSLGAVSAPITSKQPMSDLLATFPVLDENEFTNIMAIGMPGCLVGCSST